jgi:hypothetical protein
MCPRFIFRLGLVAAVCASLAQELAIPGGQFAGQTASVQPDRREPAEAIAQAFGQDGKIAALTLQRTVTA